MVDDALEPRMRREVWDDRLLAWVYPISFRPHNLKSQGIDLRQHPICYLCGGEWQRAKWEGHTSQKIIVVRCRACHLVTFARRDGAVMVARKWNWRGGKAHG